MSVIVRGLDLEDILPHLEDGDIEGTTAEIVCLWGAGTSRAIFEDSCQRLQDIFVTE